MDVQEREKKIAERERKITTKRKSPPKHTITPSRVNCNIVTNIGNGIGNGVNQIFNTVRKSTGLSDVTVTDTGDVNEWNSTAHDEEAAYNCSLGIF